MSVTRFPRVVLTGLLALFPTVSRSQGFTQVKVKNGAAAQSEAVLTFGMIFKPGDVPAGRGLAVSAGGVPIPVQADAKAAHADGSLRHAVLTVQLGALAAEEARTLQLAAAAQASQGTPLGSADVLKTEFDAKVSVTVAGTEYSASVRDLLAAGTPWLTGSLCTEWLVTARLKSAAGAVHPHLHARFAIRAYPGLKHIRADIAVENDWAFEPKPQGFTYDARITVGNATAYSKTGLAHAHHARWRKVFWWGGDPTPDYEYDGAYLMATGAFPNYDHGLSILPSALQGMQQDFEPMETGNLSGYMPETGAHDDIGPLPRFSALYLLTMDARARGNVLANGACGGSYAIHYRDMAKDMPVTIDDFPYMTILGSPSDAVNPKTGKSEAFPDVTGGLDKLTPDDAHQPSIAFLPYVITGDYFYLEELQFWASWNMILANPGYRSLDKGLLFWGQERAQAWSLRTLGQAAYITPDAHPQKTYFMAKVKNNIAWYSDKYVKGTGANKLGYLEEDLAYAPYGIAPWQDNFFTWSIGYLAQLGFTEIKPFLEWKTKFVVGMFTDPDYCWLKASAYSLQVSTAGGVPYKSLGEIFQANFPAAACAGLAMDGYPDVPTGYGANLQPALAVAVDAGGADALQAWEKYQSRLPKQVYGSSPQFNVVPRGGVGAGIRENRRPGGLPEAPRLAFPGYPFGYRVVVPGEVYMELFDTGGHRLLAGSLGYQNPGVHTLDWRATAITVHHPLGARACLIRIRTLLRTDP